MGARALAQAPERRSHGAVSGIQYPESGIRNPVSGKDQYPEPSILNLENRIRNQDSAIYIYIYTNIYIYININMI